MPEIQKVIADTSVLIAFEKLKLLDLLCLVYEQMLLPLIDDLKARKTARTLGCQISGTIGVYSTPSYREDAESFLC